MPRPAVSAMYVIKNEEEYLPYSIQSIYPVVDEIVVVDNGSTDRTVEIARKFDKVRLYFSQARDFSVLRNLALQKSSGEWLMKIDADEVFFEDLLEAMPRLVADPEADGYYCWFYHLMRDYHLIQNTSDYDENYRRIFLVRRTPRLRWVKPVHEELEGIGERIKDSRLHYVHYGYVKPQREVFRRWLLYGELEGDISRYEGVDPDTILDRRPVFPFTRPHPGVIREYIRQKAGISLALGAGPGEYPGFEVLDRKKLPHVKHVADARHIPLPDGSVTRLAASTYILEHIPRAEVLPTLREWHRVLRRGGTIWIRVHHLKPICAAFAAGEMGIEEFHHLIYGSQKDEGSFHFTAFTPDYLEGLMRQAGFAAIRLTWEDERGFELEGVK